MRPLRPFLIGFFAAQCAACATASGTAAPPEDGCGGFSLPELQALEAGEFAPPEPAAAGELALALSNCLFNPDPWLRDDIGYTGISRLLRSGAVTPPELQTLRSRLLGTLAQNADEEGFARPFAALVLSEVVRVDRITPYLSEPERAATLTAACDYLASIRDYRGFDRQAGWRHGVAHAADVLLQFALNPAT